MGFSWGTSLGSARGQFEGQTDRCSLHLLPSLHALWKFLAYTDGSGILSFPTTPAFVTAFHFCLHHSRGVQRTIQCLPQFSLQALTILVCFFFFLIKARLTCSSLSKAVTLCETNTQLTRLGQDPAFMVNLKCFVLGWDKEALRVSRKKNPTQHMKNLGYRNSST